MTKKYSTNYPAWHWQHLLQYYHLGPLPSVSQGDFHLGSMYNCTVPLALLRMVLVASFFCLTLQYYHLGPLPSVTTGLSSLAAGTTVAVALALLRMVAAFFCL